MSDDTLCRIPAWELADLIRRRKVSPVEVTRAVLERIERLNGGLNAFINLYPELTLAEAHGCERAVMAGESLGMLHGVPVSLKDNYWTRGLRTTFGSKLMADFVPTEDAPSVNRLKRAGAVNIGKTNVPEFAWRGSTDNPLFGPTRNPWNREHTSGGSSGGAAAAVAAGMGPLALSGDGAGSTRIPASFCGVVGLKPSRGRVALYPSAAANELLLQAGPIARTVRDAALMLSAMAGPDRRDPLCLPIEGEDFARNIDQGVRGLRIAWSPTAGFMPVESETRDIAERAARTFQELGAIVEDAAPTIDDPQWILDLSFGANAAGQHSRRPDAEKQQMDPALVAYAEAIGTTTLSDLVRAVIGRQTVVRRLSDFFERYDLLLTPTVGLPAFPIGIVGPTEVAGQKVRHLCWSSTYVFNWSGQPAMSVPAGWTKDGLPVGLQIIGRRLDDALVIAAGAAFEAARPWADRWPGLNVPAH